MDFLVLPRILGNNVKTRRLQLCHRLVISIRLLYLARQSRRFFT
jgi:hypothetical protein